MGHYEFEREGELVDAVVQWVGDGYEVKIGGRSWHINPVDVVSPESPHGSANDVGTSPPHKTAPARQRTEPGEGGDVHAPLAGKIIGVMVEEGDRIEPGDVLFKLEAMKLETELPAEFSGIVGEVLVSEGQNIEEGDKLLIVEAG